MTNTRPFLFSLLMWLIGFVGIAGFCVQIYTLWDGFDYRQKDLATYYCAAKAYFFEGQNPYQVANLREVAIAQNIQIDPINPYIYPLYCLFVFLPLSLVFYVQAYSYYLVLKVLILCFLLFYGFRFVGSGVQGLLFIGFALFSFKPELCEKPLA